MGEYWRQEGLELGSYLDEADAQMALFEVALHFHFRQASISGRDYDPRTIFDGPLVKSNLLNAVTFVDNHDSQRGQALQTWVDGFTRNLPIPSSCRERMATLACSEGDYYGTSSGSNSQPSWGQFFTTAVNCAQGGGLWRAGRLF
ncbi:MAG: hypothetical protein GXZ04_02610 [Clostridiales bacterium]|nr:hypothetical protein [Clostridiales bacterium]